MNIETVKRCMVLCRRAGITPMIWGPPAVGKSQAVEQFTVDQFSGGKTAAETLIANFRILTGNTVTIDDLTGIPFNHEGTMQWSRPAELPEIGQGVLFIDEITDCQSLSITKGFYTIALEQRSKSHKIGKDWFVVLAGNRPEDKTGSRMPPSALLLRLCHLSIGCDIPDFDNYLINYAEIDLQGWFVWAAQKHIRPEIVAFLKRFPEYAYKFQATPRTFEMVSKLIDAAGGDLLNKNLHTCIVGTIGKEAGYKLISFFRIISQIPDIDTILQDPDTAEIPADFSILYALCASLIYISDKHNAAALVRYGRRLPAETSVFLLETIRNKNNEIAGLPEFICWRNENADIIG